MRVALGPSHDGVQSIEHDRLEHRYTPPYLAFMLRAAGELALSPGQRIKKSAIKAWLTANWPEELGECSDWKAESMATFLREPAFESGGLFARKERSTAD